MKRRNIKNNNKGRRLLLLVSIIFFIMCLFLFTSSYFEIRKVEIIGANLVKEEEILNLSGIKPLDNYFRVNIKKIKEELISHPVIKKVEIRRKLLNTIIIEITEREPYIKINNQDKYLIIDKEKVILFKINKDEERKWRLAKLDGIRINPARVGKKIRNNVLDATLECIKYSNYILPRKINRIVVSKNNLWFYTNDNLKVNLGSMNDIEEKIYNLSHVLKIADEKDIKIDYVNMTVKDRPAVGEYKKINEE